MVAHDLRNPLNVARAHAQILDEEASDQSEEVDRLVQAHDRMERIIDDLLTLARRGEAIDDPEPVDVGAVASEAWVTVRTGDAELRIDGAPSALADPTRLRELFENLFRNAVEHGSTGSRASLDDAEPGVSVELGELADGFYVADDGPGIPTEERERVFDSGFTTDDDGTGFGLSIVERIVDAHGWSIDLTDSEAGGARFEITGVESPLD